MVSYNYNGEYVLISKGQYNDADNCIVRTKNSDLKKKSAIGTLASALMLVFLSAALILGTTASASATGSVGTMTVTPTSAYAGSTGNSFNFEFNSDSYTFSNGRVYITVPSGWTAPTMSPGDGYVAIIPGTCSGASLSAVTGMMVRINNINCNPSQTFTLTYSGVTAPVSTGIDIFTTSTNSAQNGGVTQIGTSPTVTVNNLLPTTTSISPNSKNVGDAEFTMTVTGTNFVPGSEVRFDGAYRTTTYLSSTLLNATIPASDMLTAGTYSITVFNPTSGGGTSNPQTFTVNTVSKLNQDITFGTLDGKTYGDSDFSIAATASSGLTVSFAASGDCTVSVNTVHIIGTGSCTITASQGGNETYNPAADVNRAFSIAKANPTISVTPYSVTYDGNLHTATGTATGVNSESLGGLDLSGTTHTNAGNYPSDAWTFTDVTGNYNDTSGIVSDSIAKVTPTITWSNPADITVGTALSITQLNAVASVAGTYVYNPASGIVLNPGAGQTLHADFTPSDTTNYTVASMDVTINVTGTLPATRYINGTVTDSGSHLPLAGVTVSITGGSLPVVTDGTGNYSFAVADGSYTITATLFDIRYYTYSASVDTTGVPSVTHDIELQLKPTGTISGNITVK
jgi:hypothetical protein